jgi:hypothetical protein
MPLCVYGVLIKSPPERETLLAGWRADWVSAEAGSPSPSGEPTISLRNVQEVALNAPERRELAGEPQAPLPLPVRA